MVGDQDEGMRIPNVWHPGRYNVLGVGDRFCGDSLSSFLGSIIFNFLLADFYMKLRSIMYIYLQT